MSFQPTAKPTSLADDIQKLKLDIAAFASRDATDPTVQRTIRRTENELRNRARRIEAKLRENPNVAELRPELVAATAALRCSAAAVQSTVENTQKPLPATAADYDMQEQLRISREQNEDITFLSEQTERILTDMRVLALLTEQVGEAVRKSHITVVRIDGTIADGKDQMIEGNQELEKAEDHQKKTCQVA
jgi:hypothetical protein